MSTEIQTEIDRLIDNLRSLRAEAIERRETVNRREAQLHAQQGYSRNERNVNAATTRLAKARSALETTLLTIKSAEQQIADLQLRIAEAVMPVVAAVLEIADNGEHLHIEHVLDFFKADGGYAPGHFGAAILEALAHADLGNRARLTVAFPEWAKPFALAKESPKGIEALQLSLKIGRTIGAPLIWGGVLLVERMLLDDYPADEITVAAVTGR